MEASRWLRLVLIGLLVTPAAAKAGGIEIDGQFVSTVPPGTPPLDVSSGTRVDDLNADLLDGLDAASFLPAAERVLVVSPSGGHFTSIQAAIDSIADATATNRYLVLVGPGVYTEQVTLEPFVDVQGSGQDVTTIRWTGDVTVTGADDSTLSRITVENLDDGIQGGRSIRNFETSPRLVHVTATAVSTANGATAIENESFGGTPPSPVLRHVTATASGPSPRAIENIGVEADLFDVQASAVGEDARGIVNSGDSRLVRVTASAESAVADVGLILGVFNDDSAPELIDVEARASGGNQNIGVLNQNADAEIVMTRVRAIADADGGSKTRAIENDGSSVELRHCTALASGGDVSNDAIYNEHASAEIFGSRLRATGTGPTYGVHNLNPGDEAGSWFVELHSSQVFATTRTVLNHEDFSVFVGASNLGGGDMDGGGTLICAGVYDGTFAFYASSCPLAGP